jgi:hypothetical protein
MENTFTKRLFFLAIFTLFTLTGAFAQTITVGTVDPGPYGQGSSIAVPINVNTSAGCINSANTFNLYLSDASGNFSPGTLIGSYTGSYATFVNGVIPNGTPAGSGYKVEVKSTSPAVTSSVSSAFTISASAGVTASLSTTETVSAGVFGRCVGSTAAYNFTTSSGGTVTASFFNESTQSYEASNVAMPGSFTPSTTNYTVTGKSVNGGIVGTYDYQLVNNVVVNPFSPFGTPFVCIPSGGTGDLQFIMPISGPGGISNNYPGTTYTVNWGDGTSTTFTYCQIVALGGILVHTYSLPSCGQTSTGGASNSLTVVSHAVSPYCGEIASAATTSAKVIITPTTSFTAPSVACVGTALTIPNTSNPGPDYSTTASSSCAVNANALYDWYLDGSPVAGYQGVKLGVSFVLPATTTHGTHTVMLHAETPAIGCSSPDYSQTICFEDPPSPSFTISSPVCVSGGALSPTNTSTYDNTCAPPQYTWTVTGPGSVSYAGGTNANSAVPQFVFPTAGTYTVTLGITAAGCGLISTAPQTVVVDAAPTASLSPDVSVCGTNVTYTFNNSAGITKTTFSGTTVTAPSTYNWTISGGAYSFTGGTSASSKYPKILFTDYATYTITATNTNSCGVASDTQKITFVQAPTVDAGSDQTVCASSPAATLSGSVTGSYTSYQWVGGTGTFSPNRNTLTATYTPSAAEITAGTVTLTLQANTSLPAPCNIVTDPMTINITPTVFITSPPTAVLCSGQALSYNITASQPGTTYAWTASVTSGSASGFTASGTSASITDVLTNSGTVDAVVSYNILPTFNSCPGTPFTLDVTVHPLPIITAAPVSNPICNNQPANIVFSSNVANTTYTWTSVADPGITGNSNQAAAIVTTSIQDILVNSGTTPANVTYTVTPYNGTCAGPPVITSITVEPSPKPSVPGPDDEVCSTTTYTLQGNDPSPGTGKWTVVSGSGTTFSDDTNPNAVVSGLVPGNSYQFKWTITDYASCPSTSNVVKITVDKAPIGGTTSSDAEVCSGSNGGTIALAGEFGTILRWESSLDNGSTWQPIANTGNTLVYTNLTQTTQYRAVLHNGVCPDAPSTATTITVDPPPVASVAGPDDEVCSTTTYTLQGNNPAPGTGKWTETSGPVGITFSDDTNPNAVVSGLIPGNTYKFTWTITGTASCPPTTSVVTIIIDKAPVGGTTSGDATVCSGSNSGTIPLSGEFGTIVRWESSIDNGATWQPIANTGTTQAYTNLVQTTQYRAILHNGVCPDAPSTVTTITVDAPPIASVAGPNDQVCGNTVYTLQGNNPAPGTGKWTETSGPPGVTFSDDTNPNAVASGLIPGNTYKFTWTISNTASCPPTTSDVTIIIDKAPAGTTSSDAEVCSGSNNGTISLTGQFNNVVRWESSTDNGTSWQPIANTGTSQSYLNLVQTTQYRAILHNPNTCSDVPSSVTTITVDAPPIASNAGHDDEVCSTTTYTLQGNNPAPGTGKWTMTSGPSAAVFSDDTNPNAVVTGLIPGTYTFKWTISNTASCPPTTSLVNIVIDKAPVGGTTSTDATVCSGSNNGTISLNGQFGTVVRWESSTDNGTSWQPIANTGVTQSYVNLTQTTQYRVILHSGVCPDVPSSVTTITVDAPPIASVAGPNDEVCSTTTYTLQGNNPSPGTGKWTKTNGPAGVTFSDDTNPNAVVTGLIPGNSYQFTWTISNTASCPPTSSAVNIVIDKTPLGGVTTSDATVCSGSNNGTISLAGQGGSIVRWESSTDNGTSWQPIANTGITQTYLNLTQTTQYRAVLHNGVCPDAYSTVTTIKVDMPPVASNAGPDDEVCSTTTYTLHGNDPAPGTGKWTETNGPAGVIFSDDTNKDAVVTGLIPGNTYQFTWTISNTASCPPTTSVVNIIIDKAPVGGTTSSDATVCSGGNNGTISLAGQSGSIVRWESSTDNGATWKVINNTGTTQTYTNLTQTTQYRAILKTAGVCPEVPSTASTITVNPQTPIATTGPDYDICNSTVITLSGNDPAPFSGVWTQIKGPAVNILNPNNYETQVTGLSKGNVYTFQWTIKGLPPCGDTFATINVGAYADVIPSFAMDQDHGCGPTTVTFTNTSTPSPVGTFKWDFGDGSPVVTAVNPPSHTFAPSTDGTEKTYKITMTPVSNCDSRVPYVDYIKVSPQSPVAVILPDQSSACGAFTLTAKNLSPGNNVQYDFYLKDAQGNILQHLTYPDTRDAVFKELNPTEQTYYTVYVVATDKCGNQASSPPQNISVAPSSLISKVQIKGNVQSVCLGSPVTFQNISTGGDRFTITIYDASKNPILTLPSGTGDLSYTPTEVGIYYVSITAGNQGCGNAPVSELVQYTVYPTPNPSFTYTSDKDFNVVFTNTTPDDGNIPASSINYQWDFGDGSAYDNSYQPTVHKFNFDKAPYTVTLTATTPGTNCFNIVQQKINVVFKGNLFLPNAFIPASADSRLNTFKAQGFGLKTWRMQIFNNFGQLVWETTKLDNNGSPVDGWDGTYKGQIVEQGVYIWQITATLLNGEDWKGMSFGNSAPSKTGAIHLIR